MNRDRRIAGALIALSLATMSGCAAHATEDPSATSAKIQPVAAKGPFRVVLRVGALKSLGIATRSVREMQRNGRTVIPFTSVVYDQQGRTWAYVRVGQRSFVRSPITVDRVDSGQALLASGPPEGTAVVTAGVPVLLGIEYGSRTDDGVGYLGSDSAVGRGKGRGATSSGRPWLWPSSVRQLPRGIWPSFP